MSNQKGHRRSWWISAAVLVLMILVSGTSLFYPGLYRDNGFVKAVWRGNDAVTLLAAAPVFAAGLVLSRRGSVLGDLIRLGMLDFALYNFAFYLFASAFNALFIPYVLLIVLSMMGLLTGLAGLDAPGVKDGFRQKLPVRWVGGYLIIVALGLTIIYLIQVGQFLTSGHPPEIIARTGHVTHIVPALDLTLLVPWLILAGVWLWRRKPWGYLLSGMMVVKGLLYTLVLAAAGYSAVRAGYPEAAGEIPLWGSLSGGFLVCLGFIIGNYQRNHAG